MPVRQSQIKANAKYDKTHTTGFYLKLNNKTDADIMEKLAAVENKQGYIKRLIREDIARTCPGSVPDSVPDADSIPDSKPVPYMDPFAGTLAKAVGTWIDKATEVLTDGKVYMADSVPESEEQ